MEQLNKLCNGAEKLNRKDGIKMLIAKGLSEKSAVKYYNLWRKQYLTTLINIT